MTTDFYDFVGWWDSRQIESTDQSLIAISLIVCQLQLFVPTVLAQKVVINCNSCDCTLTTYFLFRSESYRIGSNALSVGYLLIVQVLEAPELLISVTLSRT